MRNSSFMADVWIEELGEEGVKLWLVRGKISNNVYFTLTIK